MQTDCPLTEKQIEIVSWLSHGKTFGEIAEFLGISRKAVSNRMDRAWVATGTRNRHGIVAMALRKGWIE